MERVTCGVLGVCLCVYMVVLVCEDPALGLADQHLRRTMACDPSRDSSTLESVFLCSTKNMFLLVLCVLVYTSTNVVLTSVVQIDYGVALCPST